jgi:putative Mg2+ transporter-C (MgtC) family protein
MRIMVLSWAEAPVYDQLQITAKVFIAVLLGAITGMERRRADKPAGTRTHALVAGAAALTTAISIAAVESFGVGDPTRGIHAVITGIGFLGAGAILHPRSGDQAPTGLTTAASVFYTACVGIAVASGYVLTAVLATCMSFALLRLVGMWRHRHDSHHGTN